MDETVIAVVFARGGSKGVPGKNLRLLGGRSLLERAVETARRVPSVDRVIVSTEDEAISREAARCGAEVPFRRPEELAGDDSPEWLAWQHAVRTWREEGSGRAMDVLVSVPTTAPLRASADVEACIRLLRETGADAVITVTPAARSPWFNMVILDGDQASLVMRPERALHVRQAAPPVFDMTTVAYAARSRFVLEASSLFEGDLRAVVVPPERALDIDSELDLEIAEFLLQRSEGP